MKTSCWVLGLVPRHGRSHQGDLHVAHIDRGVLFEFVGRCRQGLLVTSEANDQLEEYTHSINRGRVGPRASLTSGHVAVTRSSQRSSSDPAPWPSRSADIDPYPYTE